MTRTRSRLPYVVLVLLLLMGLSAAAVWAFWPERRGPVVASAGENVPGCAGPGVPLGAGVGAQGNTGGETPAAGVPAANAGTTSLGTELAQPSSEPSKDSLWLVGRVKAVMLGDLDLWKAGKHPQVSLDCFEPGAPDTDGQWHWFELEMDSEGRFRVEVPPECFEPKAGPHLLWAAGASGWGSSVLQRARDDGAEGGYESLPGLLKPVYRDNLVDFGDLVLGEGLLDHTWLFRGRVLGPGARPLRTMLGVYLQLQSDSEEAEPADLNYDPIPMNCNGEFVYAVECRDGDVLAGVQLPNDAQELATRPWRVCVRDADWYFEDNDPSLPSSRVAHPVLRGRVLDLGDVQLPGALLEFTIKVNGAADTELPPDPCLHEWTSPELFALVVENNLTSSQLWMPAGPTFLILLPEGRYNWTCVFPVNWLPKGGSHGEQVGLSARGTLVLPNGELTRLVVELKMTATVPVRCVDEQDRPVHGAEVVWELPGQGYAVRAPSFRVPVVPGTATQVRASVSWTEHAEDGADTRCLQETTAEARVGDKEVVLRFAELPATLVAQRGTLQVQLPLLPEAFGLSRLDAKLVWRGPDGATGSEEVDVERVSGVTIELRDLVPGSYVVELRGGAIWGHVNGLLCSGEPVEVIGGQVVQLRLQAIAEPPEKTPAGSLEAVVRVGGVPTRVATEWIGADGARRLLDVGPLRGTLWTVRAPDSGRAKGVECDDTGFLPREICDGERRLPVQIEAPATAWGEKTVTADLPSRLRLRVLFKGAAVPEISAELRAGKDGSVAGGNAGGEMLLWAPVGKASLVVWAGNNRYEHRTEVELTDAEQVLALDLADKGLARLQLDRELVTERALWRFCGPSSQQEWWHFFEGVYYFEPGTYELAPAAEFPQEAAFKVELAAGQSRQVTLPPLKQRALQSVRIAMSAADWEGYESAEIEAAVLDGMDGATPAFGLSFVPFDVKELPDALEVMLLTEGTRVVIRGQITRQVDGVQQVFRMAAKTVLVKKGVTIQPGWQRAVPVDHRWEGLNCFATQESPDGWTLFWSQYHVTPGRHELVFFSPDKAKELFRLTLDVADNAEVVTIPVEAQAKLREAGYVIPEPDGG